MKHSFFDLESKVDSKGHNLDGVSLNMLTAKTLFRRFGLSAQALRTFLGFQSTRSACSRATYLDLHRLGSFGEQAH